MTQVLNEEQKSDPWYNPQSPTAPKPWIERKKELDTALWVHVRNLATIGHKKVSPEGGVAPLIQYHELLRMPREDVKKSILEHEFTLGWVTPPEPTASTTIVTISPGEQVPNTLTTPIVVDMPAEPSALPMPPPVPGRRRRAAVAPPPVAAPVSESVFAPPPEVPMSQPLAFAPMMSPMQSVPVASTGVPAEIVDLQQRLVKLQDSLDKIGNNTVAIGNNGDTHYKLTNQVVIKLGEMEKRMTLISTALHHLYVSDPNLVQQLAAAGVDPKTVQRLGDFLGVMAKFAGVQYP